MKGRRSKTAMAGIRLSISESWSTDHRMLDSRDMKSRRLKSQMLLLALLVAAFLGGCGEPGSDPQVDREEIESVLREYLPKLGQAYAQRDTSILEGFAVPKEMARISLRTEELAETGRVYEPEFKEVTVEDISTWNYSNAFVTTLEVWDVRSFTLGTHLQVNESLGQRNRVKYQMKRKEGSWVILYRELDQTFERSDQ